MTLFPFKLKLRQKDNWQYNVSHRRVPSKNHSNFVTFCINIIHLFTFILYGFQRAKKVVSDSPGLVDFDIGLVNFVRNLPNGQVTIFEEFKLQKNCEINSAHQNVFGASGKDVWDSILIINTIY